MLPWKASYDESMMSEAFVLLASLTRSPTVLARLTRSLPARSTRCMVLTIKSSFVYWMKETWYFKSTWETMNIRVSLTLCHCQIERDASRVHYAIDWIPCSVAYERFGDASSPCSTIRWLRHLSEPRFLSPLECKVFHDDPRGSVWIVDPYEEHSASTSRRLLLMEHSLVQNLIIEQIIDVIVVDFDERHEDYVGTIFVQLRIP